MFETLVGQFLSSSFMELTAVLFALAYLTMVVRENILCWYAALISTLIFLVIFWRVQLYMEAGLQLYYVAMAIYGWHQWSRGGTQSHGITITTWSIKTHILAVFGILLATLASGIVLTKISNAYFPFLDSFTTWASIVTTFMVAKKILENWIYWFVIDGISVFIYFERELYFTTLLFVIYLVIVVIGYLSWLKDYRGKENTQRKNLHNALKTKVI